jgi:two-component system, OmpR family, response regulator
VTDSVLVVDDSTFIVEGLVALLKRSYRTIPSFGGEECLQILRTETPSVIILDIMMEPMDGWETLSRIKSNPRTRHIPVLMFSAKKISFEEAEAHRIRIDDFLTKPVNPRVLLAVVARILERQNRKKRTLAWWTARGVPQEKIEEYLNLSSNHEIDTSLLAVMQNQLAHPSITEMRREELASSVRVLEERIRTTESLTESFFRDTGISLPSDAELLEPPAEIPGTSPDEILSLPVETDGGNLPAEIPGTSPDETLSLPVETDGGNLPAEISGPGTPGNDSVRDESGDSAFSSVPAADSEMIPSPQPEQNIAGEYLPDPVADTGTPPDVPVEEPVPAMVPFDHEGIFESEPPPDQAAAIPTPPAPCDLLPESDLSLSPGSPSLPPRENEIPSVNVPDSPVPGPEKKIPPQPAPQPATGSSGRGILAVILRLIFGPRK